MSSPDLVTTFLDYAERDRRRSPHTLARYRTVLANISEHGDLASMDLIDVDSWWDSRMEIVDKDGIRPRSGASRANELACARAFFRWATKYDHRPDDPTRRLEFPGVENHVPRAIGQSDLERLLGPLTADALDLRRAVALGTYAGMRVSEAAELQWKDVDTEAHRIYVRGKGRKERVTGLHPILLDKILPMTGGNVVAAGGHPYTGAVLQRKVNRLMARNEIAHTFHDCRKRGVTLALARGMNPEAVRQVFGWSSMQTVTHYAVVGSEELDKIAEAMI